MNHPELNKISYLTRWSFLLAIVPMLVAPLVLLPVNHAFAAQYLNSAEPMCSGSTRLANAKTRAQPAQT